MQICAPLTRSQCKVSDTQVTIRPVGLLFIFFFNKRGGILTWVDICQNFNSSFGQLATDLRSPDHETVIL